MCCTVVFYTQNHLAQVLYPRCKLVLSWGRGSREGEGEACSAGHTPALILLGMMDAASAVA